MTAPITARTIAARVRRALEAPDSLWLFPAFLVLGYVFWRQTLLASRLIDGVRWYWLDDDMMISMRYARNLAEGNGLVWTPGERVEGYSNFLWTMVMAVVHLFRPEPRVAALPVRAIGFLLTLGSLVLSVKLLRVFVRRGVVAAIAMLVAMVLCPDIVLWAVWGFENALLGFLLLFFLLRLFQKGDDRLAYLALALVPLTRADGLYLFAANALVALVVSKNRPRTIVWLAAACIPSAAHFAFRLLYYGEWLPNTYYLKVYGLTDKHTRGFLYAQNFLQTYTVLVTLAVASGVAIARRDRRGVAVIVLLLANLGYVVLVGSDMFLGCRFFSHLLPILIVYAAAGIGRLATGLVPRLGWAAVLLVVSIPIGMSPLYRLLLVDTNGDQQKQIQVAALINKNALPDSSMAILCAGLVPYMTRLPAYDMLGKSDKHIARLMPYPGSMSGHGKVDTDYIVGRRPDLIVTCNIGVTYTTGIATGTKTTDPQVTFLAAPSFKERYLPYAIDDDGGLLFNANGIYTHEGSREAARRHWTKKIVVAP